jgi:hypothetical protein
MEYKQIKATSVHKRHRVSEKEQCSEYETHVLYIQYFITKHEGYKHMSRFTSLCSYFWDILYVPTDKFVSIYGSMHDLPNSAFNGTEQMASNDWVICE